MPDITNSPKQLTVFISWSGASSLAVAKALFSWLPQILPFVKPWLSSEEIIGGEKWNPQLESILQKCNAGIFCITSDNQSSQWLHFEAGAIAIRPERPPIIPYLFNVAPGTIPYPLAQYHQRASNLEGTTLLIKDLFRLAHDAGIIEYFNLDQEINNKYPLLESRLQEVSNRFGKPIISNFRLPADIALDYHDIIDDQTNEVIITGQNMQGLIRGGIFPFLAERFRNNARFNVLILLTIPQFFNVVGANAQEKRNYNLQFKNTLKNLEEFRLSLPPGSQSSFTIYFHPGVSSLSAIFRDNSDKNRGLAVIMPKWATDNEPGSRLYCVIDRINNDNLFNRMFGHIGIMKDPVHSKTLDEMITWANKTS